MVATSGIKVIILAGRRDFGRYLLAADLPTALWPVAGKPALQRLLDSLADQGIGEAVVCSNGESSLLAASVQPKQRMKVEFLEEALPVGTAGAIRDAGRAETDALLIVFPASMVSVPKIETLLDAHRSGQCGLTVMFNPDGISAKGMGQASGIYVCSSEILGHIPSGGYYDIKEGLIPEMVRVGKSVHAAVLPNHIGNFRDRRGYLYAIGDYLESVGRSDVESITCEHGDSQDVCVSSGASVHSGARICGPTIIMDGAGVSRGAVILGPTVLGCDVEVGVDAVVVGSVVWDGARLGRNCRVQRSLIGRGAVVGPNRVVQEQSVSATGALGRCRWGGVLKQSIKTNRKWQGGR